MAVYQGSRRGGIGVEVEALAEADADEARGARTPASADANKAIVVKRPLMLHAIVL